MKRGHCFTHPGQSSLPTDGSARLIRALAISGVVVTMHNSRKRFGGLTHYISPIASDHGSDGPLEDGRYGDSAIRKLIEALRRLDPAGRKGDLRARVFGAARVDGYLASNSAAAESNGLIARATLEEERIEIDAIDIGGFFARKIKFDTFSGATDVELMTESTSYDILVSRRFPGARFGGDGSRARILSIDASTTFQRALRRALGRSNQMEILPPARSAEEGRAFILRYNPDLILTEIALPDIDGLTFIRRLREHYARPIIIVSSLIYEGSSARREALACGARALIDKGELDLERREPLSSEEGISRLRSAILAALMDEFPRSPSVI